MFNLFRAWLLRILRVPLEPEPPFGDPVSTRVFRASPKFYSLRLLGWVIKQLFLLVSLAFGVGIMLAVEYQASYLRNSEVQETASPVSVERGTVAINQTGAAVAKAKRPHRKVVDDLARVLAKVPPKLFVLIWILKAFGLAAYLFQLLTTYAALRLDYEMRWYVVTDRSLRIRTGLWRVRELTMSFANLQHVALSQGPIQRLLGIADVRVQSAGGHSEVQHQNQMQGTSLHTGYFHGVDNATEVRDLILARLRHFRETGLGDADEVRHAATPSAMPAPIAAMASQNAETIQAARELLMETRRLRAFFSKQT